MINIVRAKENDRKFISDVCRSNSILYDPILPGAFEKQAEKFLANELPLSYDIHICKYANKKIGFVGIKTLNTDTVYLVALYISYDNQRKGYGKLIVDYIKKEFKLGGYTTICLLVHKGAKWAIDFYKNVGFQHVSAEEELIRNYKDGMLSQLYLPNTILCDIKI